MFDSDLSKDKSRPELDLELLHTLEKQGGDAVSKARKNARIEVKLKVIVRPGNSSEVLGHELQGISTDLARGGCRLILPLPVAVGDVFRIEFKSDEHRVPLVFARCLRCRLVREDVFEAGFGFFAPIDLPASLSGAPADLSG